MLLPEKLAELHSHYGVYSYNGLCSDNGNILATLKEFSTYNYLSSFYNEYIQSYTQIKAILTDDKRARSKDLFYIGNEVIKTNQAKLFFVFEGSLSDSEKLSITVLAHLWLQNQDDIIDRFCGKYNWWTKPNYLGVKNKLKIIPEFAQNAYVTDAIRVENEHKNRELIYKEIELLKPEIVVCVGKAAQSIVGMKYLEQDTKFHSVRFPKYTNEKQEYEELSLILTKVIGI